MLRLLKQAAALAFLAAGVSAAHAFTTMGPINEAYQVPDLGYALNCPGVDLGAPKNIGEDYRRTTPVLYYAFDETFLDYFGTNGVAAVDAAFAILNNLTNVSSYSADLSEVPLEVTRVNQTAAALGLLDLKSFTLMMLMEQLGLDDPIRYVWTLHDRHLGPTCPFGNEYLTTMRNYAISPTDLDQLQYSEAINEQLYSYYILENCTAPVCGGTAQTVPFPVDIAENANRFAPVAAGRFALYGGFYNGLTRDDVAGLRYLLRSGHVHWEDTPAGSTVQAPGPLQLLSTSNLTELAQASLTNDDNTLVGLFPGLSIVPNSTVSSFVTVITTNLAYYFTNYPTDPVGSPPHQVVIKLYTTNLVQEFSRQFANVVTNSFATVGFVTVTNTYITFSPYQPVGSPPTTNSTSTTFLTNVVSGDYYLLTTTNCGVQILSNLMTIATPVTTLYVATNAPLTNAGSGTFLLSFSYTTYFTNHNFAIQPIVCSTNEPGLRRGVEKLTFVKTAFDSLLGQSYTPQTNYFTMTMVTNSTNWTQTYQRVVNTPDFVFGASDQAPGPADPVLVWSYALRNVNWNSNHVLVQLAGPGTIDPPTRITFNKVGPILYNHITLDGTYFMDQASAFLYRAIWGSFDDSTNAPVVYPNGTSLASLESQMMMQVTSVTLPSGKAGTAYSTQLTGTGGSPPYIWSLAPRSPALPPGLVLAPNGILSGTPTASGISSFFVQMTGTDGGFTVWQVTITVLP